MAQELKPIKQGSVELGEYWVYDAEEVDAVLAEKDKEIAELKCQVNGLQNRSNLWLYNAVEEHKKFVQADKVIAELKSQKAQAEDDCAYWKMRKGNAVNAMHETEEACMFLTKSERHQKYKRCLAMARVCRLRARWFGDNAFYKKEQWALQWHKRWLELAEKFKEAK